MVFTLSTKIQILQKIFELNKTRIECFLPLLVRKWFWLCFYWDSSANGVIISSLTFPRDFIFLFKNILLYLFQVWLMKHLPIEEMRRFWISFFLALKEAMLNELSLIWKIWLAICTKMNVSICDSKLRIIFEPDVWVIKTTDDVQVDCQIDNIINKADEILLMFLKSQWMRVSRLLGAFTKKNTVIDIKSFKVWRIILSSILAFVTVDIFLAIFV